MNDNQMLPGDRHIMNMRVTAISFMALVAIVAVSLVAVSLHLRH